VSGEDELFTLEIFECEATGHDTRCHDEGLGNGGVLDGFFFGFGAVVNQVDTCSLGESFQVLAHPFNLKPGAQKALLLGSLTGANECAHAVRPF
jgi:glutamate synthase domain 3 protein